MEWDMPVITTIGLVLTIVGVVLTSFKYFTAEISSVRREAEFKATSVSITESKARDALAATMQIAISGAQNDIKAIGREVATLSSEVVRKGELMAMENRMTLTIGSLEARIDRRITEMARERTEAANALSAKIDRLIERRNTAGDD